jgi:hypothetical protein
VPSADASFTWQEALTAFAIIALVAFLITWVLTDVLGMRRAPYVPILLVVTLGLGTGYGAWSGTSMDELLSSGMVWAVVTGLVAAAIAIPLVRRLPVHPHASGGKLVGLMVWEGVLYGIAEALLLSTFPVLAVWQACAALGWTDGAWPRMGSGALAIGGSLFVILVHHLGYAEFRTKGGRPGLFGALAVCGMQAIAFLATGNALAPIVAHVVLHGQLLLRGDELPPARVPEPALQT